MTNIFLKVNKDLFKLGLNPTEILLMAQVMEYQVNTGDFFMSDELLAGEFGVSVSTISRAIKALKEKHLLIVETKYVRGGRERHIQINTKKIEELLSGGIQPSK